ncbi:MAG: gluconokinase [Actinomycetales bacterium]|nr:gluconokinase [Actinomycetales bacterium]
MPAAIPSVVVMGVSGSGKSAVGSRLAEALDAPFVDGDDLHPAANVRKMASGRPLDDADRAPWLDAIAGVLADGPVVVACSALKRAYRDRLRRGAPDLALVVLEGDRALFRSRMTEREGHFMPTALLDSQFATLEPPTDDEDPIRVDAALPLDGVVEVAAAGVRARAATPAGRSEADG